MSLLHCQMGLETRLYSQARLQSRLDVTSHVWHINLEGQRIAAGAVEPQHATGLSGGADGRSVAPADVLGARLAGEQSFRVRSSMPQPVAVTEITP